MHILALEPYAALSHVRFLEGWRARSRHRIEIETLPARSWKWRMRTASLHWAERLAAAPPPDLVLVSDYVNAAELRALLPAGHAAVPLVVYFHENQLTYPLQPGERRDVHHAFTHLHAILASAAAWFNSSYHLEAFHAALEDLVIRVPDVDLRPSARRARERSSVVPLATDVAPGEPRGPRPCPRVLWSQRWEYDKGPAELLETVRALRELGDEARFVVAGQRFRRRPPELDELLRDDAVEAVEFLEDRRDYEELLAGCDVVLSTARHEFFGLAVLEAVRAGCLPVVPDDLAYGELFGGATAARSYDREAGPLEPLLAALAEVRGGERMEERRALVRATDRLSWSARAPELDDAAERLAARG